MASYNRVILLGNLTRDPQIRYLPSGVAVCDLGLAVNDRRKNANGEWVDEATFVDITLWERTAEIAGEYLSKGSPVLIEGRLKLDTWQDKDGQKRSKLKVTGDRMQLLGTRGAQATAGAPGGQSGNAGDGGAAYPSSAKGENPYNQSVPAHDAYEPSAPEAQSGDDIPF